MLHPRVLRALLLTLSTAVLLATASVPVEASTVAPDIGSQRDTARDDPTHRQVLSRASAALGGQPAGPRVDATIALRDLFLARPALDAESGRQAGQLLARPTDGSADPYGDGYDVASVRTCSKHVCVHWVKSTQDAPPNGAWAAKTLQVMESVWRHHIGKLGYRPPATDGGRGGNNRFDVYLKELGANGLYGYCAPERRVPGRSSQASGFCVLDNDFAKAQFGRKPADSLRVTAAHEFFHAIQFAYDFNEDPWLLESSATWMEERFADSVNDNRMYLRYGQISKPATSLDLFEASGLAHYGNWSFWEYLSERYGQRVVRQVIERTGTGGGLPNDYSMQAVRRVLQKYGGFARVFAAYVAGNTDPKHTYAEGGAFPVAPAAAAKKLRAAARKTTYQARVNHLAAKTLKLKPGQSLAGTRWRLRISIDDAPVKAAAPVVMVVGRRTDGTRFQRRIKLNNGGTGRTSVAFSHRTITAVSVVLVNASTRYRCNRSTSYACKGKPLDQRRGFTVRATAFRG